MRQQQAGLGSPERPRRPMENPWKTAWKPPTAVDRSRRTSSDRRGDKVAAVLSRKTVTDSKDGDDGDGDGRQANNIKTTNNNGAFPGGIIIITLGEKIYIKYIVL